MGAVPARKAVRQDLPLAKLARSGSAPGLSVGPVLSPSGVPAGDGSRQDVSDADNDAGVIRSGWTTTSAQRGRRGSRPAVSAPAAGWPAATVEPIHRSQTARSAVGAR